jgi:hypothetical protein
VLFLGKVRRRGESGLLWSGVSASLCRRLAGEHRIVLRTGRAAGGERRLPPLRPHAVKVTNGLAPHLGWVPFIASLDGGLEPRRGNQDLRSKGLRPSEAQQRRHGPQWAERCAAIGPNKPTKSTRPVPLWLLWPWPFSGQDDRSQAASAIAPGPKISGPANQTPSRGENVAAALIPSFSEKKAVVSDPGRLFGPIAARPGCPYFQR